MPASPATTADEIPTNARSFTVGVDAPVTPEQLARIARARGVARLLGPAQLATEPKSFAELDVLFTRAVPSPALRDAGKLRWIQSFGAGVDGLLAALPEAPELRLTNTSGIHAQPIAEHAFAFILAHARRFDRAFALQAQGSWAPLQAIGSLRTLEGKTLGILGPGAIGRRIAEIARAFGMRVLGYRRRDAELEGFHRVYHGDALADFLGSSDYLVNVLPGTAQTRHLLGRGTFAAMRRGCYLVNVGRGSTVDTDALVEALLSGQLAGAGLDVTEPEPLPPGHPLWQLDNVIITPHYAGAHPDYEAHATDVFLDNLARFVAGEPLRNQVDLSAGY